MNGAEPRARHIPQRTCIICRTVEAKRGLIRLVRTAEGAVVVDERGKLRGRGAYLCHNPACWEAALKRPVLTRALRVEQISPEDRAALAAFAQTLAAVLPVEDQVRLEKTTQ